MDTLLPRILIVDDEKLHMEALTATLKENDYDTLGFTKPQDALALLHKENFDLLLTDLMMPEMSGISLLNAAQKIDPTLVGIIMTGQGTISTAVEAMKTGALDYILKPFKITTILPILSHALTVRQLRIENRELAQRPRILIVDDEPSQMEAFCNTLKDSGYETVGFTTGKTALETLQNEKFDLLLADLVMPEMDGIALLEAALKLDPNLIGIIITGQGTVSTALEAMKKGAFDYILKPFKLNTIRPVFSRALAVRKLRIKNEELEQRVQERTSELQAANEQLDSFASSVAHDLHGPISHISGYAQILLETHLTSLDATGKGYVNKIIEGSQHMSLLIKDMLAFARLTRVDLNQSSVDLNLIATEVWLKLEPETINRKIDYKICNLPTVQADSSMIHQVFYNLFSNALKYTNKREIAIIEVTCVPEKTNGIFLRDNGAGFDMKYAKNLFGIFQRLHSQQQFPGTGVGLSTVHRIIQRHGGRIWAEAAVDQGATFHFTLLRSA